MKNFILVAILLMFVNLFSSTTYVKTYNSLGRIIKPKKVEIVITNENDDEKVYVDLEVRDNGVYFVEIMINGYKRVVKIVKTGVK